MWIPATEAMREKDETEKAKGQSQCGKMLRLASYEKKRSGGEQQSKPQSKDVPLELLKCSNRVYDPYIFHFKSVLSNICCTADGLWPDYNDGSWPSCCTRSNFDIEKKSMARAHFQLFVMNMSTFLQHLTSISSTMLR
ncbi:hypothetical protein RHGRI_002649 [Rhododendron griersonianum]|uniref:Uncharacterized protein n=1 Tax=Rhododendron griersonianum TaxID=479676 RepID=A0AAV6LQ97_9ERIC|nr:hypothetical protein RHGRI_002649 [Rhododendron griersonianum]